MLAQSYPGMQMVSMGGGAKSLITYVMQALPHSLNGNF